MKALIIVSHPAPDSFNHALAHEVRDAWSSAGYDVRLRDLHVENFNPILTTEEMRGVASRDPLVQTHIADLLVCDLLGIVHPNCWGAPPAMMKGWIDRVFAPQAAYTFAKGTDQGDAPIGLLRAKAALVLNTGNTPLDRESSHFGDPLDRIWRQCILNYCGIKEVHRRLFGIVATSTEEERRSWLAQARQAAGTCYDRRAMPVPTAAH